MRVPLARKLVDVVLATVVFAAVLTFTGAVLPPGTPLAARSAAAACPQVEVVFARGRFESPGPGQLGNAFISSLSSKIGGKSMGTYAVRYPADSEIDIGA